MGAAADGADLAVGDIERLAISRQAAGLREVCTLQSSVADVFAARAGVRIDRLVREVVGPNLMMAGHGDEQFFIVIQQVPGTIETGGQRGTAAHTTGAILLALAGHEFDGLILEVQAATATRDSCDRRHRASRRRGPGLAGR